MLKDAILDLLFLLTREDLGRLTPLELCQAGVDPVKLFVKAEPHAETKLKEGRVRLIASVSIVTNTVSRIFCGPQNRAEMRVWDEGICPSMCGMGAADGHLKVLYGWFASKGFQNLAEADISGWDWSVQPWELEADMARRIRLCGAEGTEALMMRNLCHIVNNKVFVSAKGHLVAQLNPGVLPSGWYCTSSSNSAMRAIAAEYVGSDWYIAMGDDSVETYVEGAADRYAHLGKKLKMYNRCTDGVEFCSHIWKPDSWKASLSSWPKTVFRLVHNPGMVDMFSQFLYEMRHNEQLGHVMEVLMLVGWHQQNKQDSTEHGATSTERSEGQASQNEWQ